MSASTRREVIIDCDPGTDDAIALLLAFASPELDVLAVTVSGGNAPLLQTLANARGVAAIARATAPIYAGAERALLGPFPPGWSGHGARGIGGIALPRGHPATRGIAADAIRAALRDATRPMTLVAIAPATNIALMLATEPALTSKVEEIVLLSGALGRGNATNAAEFNAWADPEALAIVLASGAPITLAPINIGAGALATPDRVATIRTSGGGIALRMACDIIASLPPSARFNRRGSPLYDPVVIAWLIRPVLFKTVMTKLTVDTGFGPNRGRIVSQEDGGRAFVRARLLTELDGEGFFALLRERLAGLP